ncbi:MAG: hypothetical protein ACR2LK_04755 [Solirubrobacteraceae bacterium]
MVETEIRAPRIDPDTHEITWMTLARVCADGDSFEIGGDDRVVQRGPVFSLALRTSLHMKENPEEWTRSLPHAYRGGDLVAVLLRDDDPPIVDDAGYPTFVEPEIPEPTPAPSKLA